jgi:hypothetical protein
MNKSKFKGLCGLIGMTALVGCFIGTAPGSSTGGEPVDSNNPWQWKCDCNCYWPGSNEYKTTTTNFCESGLNAAQMHCNQDCDDLEADPLYSLAPPVCSGGGTVTTNEQACIPETEGQALDSSGDPKSTDGTMDRALSTATIILYGQSRVVTVDGSVEFAGGCASGTCPISFSSIALNVGGFSVSSYAGVTYTVNDITVVNVGPIGATQVNGVITIPRTQIRVLVDATVNGVPYAVEWVPDQDIQGRYVPSLGQFSLSADFSGGGTDLGFRFALQSASMRRAPVANAGSPQTIVIPLRATSATVTLDGRSSSDLDGNLSYINWYKGTTYLGTGATLSRVFPIGVHTVTAYTVDTTGKFDWATTTVTVKH